MQDLNGRGVHHHVLRLGRSHHVVFVVSFVPFAVSWATTVAPGTIAPPASVSVPLIPPRPACANPATAAPARKQTEIVRPIRKLTLELRSFIDILQADCIADSCFV